LKGFLKHLFFISIAFGISLKVANSQVIKDKKLVVLPVGFYLPETGFSLGGAGLLSFRFKSDSTNSRPSQLQLGGAYTQRKQILSYLFYQFYPQNGKYQFTGELGYYKYVYKYFGIGPNAESSLEENYKVTYPRLRINALKQFKKAQYLGFKFGFDSYNSFTPEPGGELDQQNILGNNGGRIIELGIAYQLDKRNNIFYPTQGMFLDAFVVNAGAYLGSDFAYSRAAIKYAYYKELATETVLAFNVQHESQFGTAPFFQLALLGGSKQLRGYFEGRFRDKNQSMLQTEFRKMLGNKFGFALFCGAGQVSPSFSNYALNNTVYSAGGGVRFRINQKEKINIRLDYGYGFGYCGNFYFTFSEAF